MTNDTLKVFWSFYRQKIDIKEFEEWIYTNKDLESEIGGDEYLELISLNYTNKNDVEKIINIVKTIVDSIDYKCSCVKLFSIDTIGMGSGIDSYLETFTQIKDRGQKYWWLHLSQCIVCKTYWLVAQEERHNDDYHLLKLNHDQVTCIINNNIWPNDFDSYEDLLILSKKAGHSVRFVDPLNSSMIYTVIDLAKNRPGIDSKEIADLLNIDIEIANELSRIAMQREKVKIKLK